MIIAFSGPMGVGKSTAIEAMMFNRQDQVKLVKFAQPLYDMQEFIYRRIKTAYQRPDDFIKDRQLLQWLGSEWGRTKNENLWVNLWKEEALKLSKQGHIVVCDDLRFDNEAEMVKLLGGYVIKLTSAHATSRAGDLGIKGHKSEDGINPLYVDYKIANDGTKLEFNDALNELFKKILPPIPVQK